MKTDALSWFLAFTFFNFIVNVVLTSFYSNSISLSFAPYTQTPIPLNYVLVISVIINILLFFYILFGGNGVINIMKKVWMVRK